MWEYRNTDELYHYGILGMKWGIRRYQNKDGSLTAAGRERYGVAYVDSFRDIGKYRNKFNQKGSLSNRDAKKVKKLQNEQAEIKKKMDDYDREHSVWNNQKVVDVEKASNVAKQLLPHDEKYALTPRAQAAAVTGMESMKKTKMGDYTYLATVDVHDPYEQDWFLNEDQTIGYAEIADLANHGYSSSKIKSLLKESYEIDEQMSKLYDIAEANNPHEDYYSTAPFDISVNDLADAAEHVSWGGEYKKEIYNYIDACVDYNKKVKHSSIQPWHYVTTDELYHYGILGMKWGVRRYQNKDGSLTMLGRARYGTAENFNRVLAAKQKAADYKKNKKAYERQARKNKAADEEIKRIKRDAGMKVKEDKKSESSAPKKEKKISEMTNKEIQEKINRIQLEKQLKREMASIQVEKVSKGKALVNKVVKMANNPIVRNALVDPVSREIGNRIATELKNTRKPTKSEKLKKQAEDLKNEAFISNYRKQIVENNKVINDHKNDPAYAAAFKTLDKVTQKEVTKSAKQAKQDEVYAKVEAEAAARDRAAKEANAARKAAEEEKKKKK